MAKKGLAGMATATPLDTHDTFVGSGALSLPWWGVEEDTGGALTAQAGDDWSVTLRDRGLDGFHDAAIGESYAVDHQVMSHAVNTLAATALDRRPEGVSESVISECRTFIEDPANADFDALTADVVLQFAAFGKVIYG